MLVFIVVSDKSQCKNCPYNYAWLPFVQDSEEQESIFNGFIRQPRWLSGLRRSRVHSLMIARRSLCPEKLGSNPGQGSKGINFSGWHGLDMYITVTKRR